MTTYNTGNPVGSSDPRDLYDNAQVIDEVAASRTALTVPDRKGVPTTTLYGLEVRGNAKIASLGFTVIEGATFSTGANVPNNSSLLLWATTDGGTGFYYYFSGEISSGGKIVPPASTPATSGGTGAGGWLVIDDLEERLGAVDSNVLFGGETAGDIANRLVNSKTVLIPTDYPSPQDAIEALHRNVYRNKTKIILLMESGYQITKGIDCRNGDYSVFSLESVDPVVNLAAGFVGANFSGIPAGVLGETKPTATEVYPVMLGFNAAMPQLNCVIDAGGLHGNGYQACNSNGFVGEGCGVINAGFRGIQQNGGYMSMYLSDWSGALGSGIRLQQAANAGARSAKADNCCSTYDSDLGAVYISRSSDIEFRGGSAQNSGAHGILGRRCKITAAEANVSGAALRGVWADTESNIDFVEGTAQNTGSSSLYSTFAGEIHAGQALLSTTSSATCINVDEGGKIYLNAGTSCEGSTGEAAVLAQSPAGTVLNSWGSKGLVFYNNAAGTVASGGSGGSFWQRFADGRMIECTLGTVDVTIASGSFSGQLTLPSLTQTFVSQYSVHLDVWGRTTAGGLGNRVFVSSSNYLSTGNNWKVKNEGVQLDGSGTALTINAVQLYRTVFGTWK